MASSAPPFNRNQAASQQRDLPPAYAQAVAAFQGGDHIRAHALAKQLVAQAPHQPEYWNLLAINANAQGQPEQAATYFRKALEAAPQSTELMANLGMLLTQTGQLEEAETSFRRALELAPATPAYAVQLSNVLKRRGQMVEACGYLEKALLMTRENLALASERSMAAMQLAHFLFDAGQRAEAVLFYYEACVCGGGKEAALRFVVAIRNLRYQEAHPEFKPILIQAFQEMWVLPASIDQVTWSLLRHEPAFIKASYMIRTLEAEALLAHPALQVVAADALLLALIRATAISDAGLEQLLTAYRRALLLGPPQGDAYDTFAIALALQCFTNEYAFFESPQETAAIVALEAQYTADMTAMPPLMLAVLACYRPLHQQPYAKQILAGKWPEAFRVLIARQLQEPLAEQALQADITAITPVQDMTSQAVRGQYEENPYPRWVDAPSIRENLSLKTWIQTYFAVANASASEAPETLEILVAGCGTGQQPITMAMRLAGARVLAVDLSKASLSYAMRKTAELNIDTIAYAQGDILELGALGRQFDIVECGGVLHHLAEPIAGWRVLADLTKPGGYMAVALYSELARRPLIAAREFAGGDVPATAHDLRVFRARILALAPDHPAAQVAMSRDFYTLSMLRDLLFHVQEHRYTIARLKSEIEELGLIFCGFHIPPEVRGQFHAMFGAQADIADLDMWGRFEEAYPQTFNGMYQFLLRKPQS